jgi:hypothetical protein
MSGVEGRSEVIFRTVKTNASDPSATWLDIARIGTLCNARRYSGLTLANLITLAHVGRQLKLENRAFVDSPRHPNTAVMAFDNRMADGKANSHTTLFGREHRVENMIVVGWIDTRASILDRHVNKIWFANAGSYAQYSRRYELHRLNGVHDQV